MLELLIHVAADVGAGGKTLARVLKMVVAGGGHDGADNNGLDNDVDSGRDIIMVMATMINPQ